MDFGTIGAFGTHGNEMISDFDEKQEYVREAMREEVEDRMTDEEQEEMIRKLFEDRVQ